MIQAPRGTFDILPESAQQRKLVEAEAERILGAAGYRRIETPIFEATELFARGVGETTDIVQKEMYTFDDGGGRSLTLRPEGTAPVCRAYLEHGMRKLAQPVKLWYLGPFFRAEAPQRGRYREFWQVGAEAIGSGAPETDAELIVLLADLLEAVGVKGTRLRLSSLGTPDTRAEYREELKAFLRAHEDELAERGPQPHRPEPDASVRLERRGYPSGHARRAEAAGPARTPTTPSTSSGSAACSTTPGIRYELDPTLVRGMDYYTRTVFEFTSDALGAQSGVGGGGRYDGLIELLDGPPTPACGWAAGVERMLLAARELPPASDLVDLFVALAKRDGARHGVRAGARSAPRWAAGATRAGRPLAQGAAQARRPDRRPVRRDHRRQRRRDAQGHGVRRAARHRRRGRDPGDPPRGTAGVKHAPRPNEYRDAWCGQLTADRADTEARVAGWVHRRRDHGGLIFIDVRDRSGIVQLVFHPEHAPAAHQEAHKLRSEDVISARGTRHAARPAERQPEPRRPARSSSRSPSSRSSPMPTRRRSRSTRPRTSTRSCACGIARSICAPRSSSGRWRSATARSRRCARS